MKSGSRTSWTPERERALLKLGKVADKFGSEKKRDWQTARDECPKESKTLKDYTNEQLRKTYTRILKASHGLCIYADCQNKADGKKRYCKSCARKNAERSLKWWNNKGRMKRDERR